MQSRENRTQIRLGKRDPYLVNREKISLPQDQGSSNEERFCQNFDHG